MVWAMLHGTQPPMQVFASSPHAQRTEETWSAARQPPLSPAALPVPSVVAPLVDEQHTPQNQAAALAAATPSPSHVAIAKAAATAAAGVPSLAAPVAATAAPPATHSAVQSDHDSHPGSYSRAQLLSLFRASSSLPPELELTLHSAPAATPWLAGCVSADALQPLLLSSQPHPAEAELRAELRRDAELTGVEEYANEWWLPSYADMAKMGLANGGRHAAGRGGGRGGKRGRGGNRGGGGGGRGGYHNYNNDRQSHSNKKAQDSPSTSQQVVERADAAAVAAVAPTAAPSSTVAAVASSPAAAAPALGAGRKGQKRQHVRSEADVQQAKKQYAQTNISRLFIGPPLPPGAPLIAAAPAPLNHMQFVLPSGSPPVKQNAVPLPAAATAASAVPPAAAATATAAAALPVPSPLPSKEAVFQQAAGGNSVADEIMRNIQMHKLKQEQKAGAIGGNNAAAAGTTTSAPASQSRDSPA